VIVLLILYIVTDPHHPVPKLYLRDFFLRHFVYFYRFYLKYAIVPFFSLTLCVMALQQAGSVVRDPSSREAERVEMQA